MSGGGSVTAGSTVRVAALFSGGTLVHSVTPVLTTAIAVLCHCVWVCVCVCVCVGGCVCVGVCVCVCVCGGV